MDGTNFWCMGGSKGKMGGRDASMRGDEDCGIDVEIGF
jgi:hypothetical protein